MTGLDKEAEKTPAAAGLLVLASLSVLAALLPWLMGAQPGIAASLSLLSLGLPVAAARAEGCPRGRNGGIVIIGAGFSGTMLAVQLLRAGVPRVSLVERAARHGPGLAYSATNDSLLLNVKTSKMSAFPEDPGHFERWLTHRGIGGPDSYARRRDYGAYLAELLERTRREANGRLELVRGQACGVETDPSGPAVVLDDGRRLRADKLVLAIGNLPPENPFLTSPRPRLIDPWSDDALDSLAQEPVLILGTGLTMIDTALRLEDRGFKGRIIALSRRGLMPRIHGGGALPAGDRPDLEGTLSHRLAAVRRRARAIGWRAAIDELRPMTQQLWRSAGHAERARFLRHLRPWWDVHRHRIAPTVAKRIEAMISRGQLEILAGKLRGAAHDGGGIGVKIRLRGTAEERLIRVTGLINCTGPASNIERTDDPLLRALAQQGFIRADSLRLGIDVSDEGAAIDRFGVPSKWLYVLGPLARGGRWEATAVPELRVLAADMAPTLASAFIDAG